MVKFTIYWFDKIFKNACVYLIIFCTVYNAVYGENLQPFTLMAGWWSTIESWVSGGVHWVVEKDGLRFLLTRLQSLVTFGLWAEGMNPKKILFFLLPVIVCLWIGVCWIVKGNPFHYILCQGCYSHYRDKVPLKKKEEEEFAEINSALQTNLQENVDKRVADVREKIEARRRQLTEALKKLEAEREAEVKELRARHKLEEDEVKGRCRQGVRALTKEYKEEVEQMKEAVKHLRVSVSNMLEEQGTVEQSRSELECPVGMKDTSLFSSPTGLYGGDEASCEDLAV